MNKTESIFRGTPDEWELCAKGLAPKIKINSGTIAEKTIATIHGRMHFIEDSANAQLLVNSKKLLYAMQDAICGLEWRKENQPEIFNKADDEKLLEWKKLIEDILKIKNG